MKIEKLKSILYDDLDAEVLVKVFSIYGNKINEIIDSQNIMNDRISSAFNCINSLITILLEKEITTDERYRSLIQEFKEYNEVIKE